MRLSEKQKEIIKIVGELTLLTAATIIAPNILSLLKPKNRQIKYRNKKIIERLVENDVIYLFGEKIRLTKKGRQLYKKIETDEVAISRQDDWNGVWHLICYDIPEKKKPERDYFQAKIQQSGLFAVQDSLWAYPWDCKEEIAIISQNLGISPYVAYLNTNYLPGQERMIKYFGLNKD